MLFDCGETWEAKKARLSEWHPFFALRPRTVSIEGGRKTCAWLQWIERSGFCYSFWQDGVWCWYYRLPPK